MPETKTEYLTLYRRYRSAIVSFKTVPFTREPSVQMSIVNLMLIHSHCVEALFPC